MPRTKSTDCLTTICLKNIAKNIDKYWFADVDRDFGENPHFLYIVGPFECLSGEQIQQLIYILSSFKLLRRQHLHVLISQNLRSLDLSQSVIIANNGLILKSIGYRCKKLTALNISNCSWIPAASIADVIRNLPLLKHLGLQRTKSNDLVMSAIAESCSHLINLEISACQITDNGAQSLCGGKLANGPKCKSLVKLDVKATKIGINGAMMIIKTFEKLQMFKFADVVEAVKQIVESNNNQTKNGENALKLCYLSATGVKCRGISSESIVMSVLCCPFVTDLTLYRGATNENVQYLLNLKFLRNLKITSDKAGDVTFDDGLLPVLKSKGDNLKYLGLYDIDDIDLCKLGFYCSNLERLKIFMPMFNPVKFNSSTNYITNPKSGAFRHLKEFMLVIGEDDAILKSSDLYFVLENALKLEKLHLINTQCLTDNLLKRILLLNPLVHIDQIELETCHHITEDSVWQLIACQSPLKQLTLTGCHEITRQNLDQFKKFSKAQNLNLSIYGNIL
ncbi:uncharacterized protein LOC126815906 [Patella vulgata]|uniref:uncharacterized protein LOC126815906 n=1 Tax=Patella vulgata TaxID=6465 RepID=UPI0024A7FFA4|nr:uncharacterized protein LOC126815906 [Patella vulgata]